MPMLSNDEATRIKALIDAADTAYHSAQLLRQQGRSIVRTDAAMMALKRAVDNARHVDFDKRRRKTKA